MNRKDIRRRLERFGAPEPSPELLDRIRNDVPDELPISEEMPVPLQRGREQAHWWQMAAAIFLLVGAGWLGWKWTLDPQAPNVGDLAVSEPRVRRTATALQDAPMAESPEVSTARPAPASALSRTDAAPPPTAGRTNAEGQISQATPSINERKQPAEREATAPAEAQSESISITAAGPAAAAKARQESRAADMVARVEKDEARRGRDSREMAEGIPGSVQGVPGGVVGGVAAPPPPAAAPAPAATSKTMAVTQAHREVQPAAPSTGGTAEPNDQPYGDVFFESAGVNPFIDTEDDALSTFGLDVDTGSYTVARRYLSDGHLPPAAAIRTEEFINYFGYGDRAPSRDDFALYAEGAPWPFPRGERYYAVRFGIRAREVSNAERKPATLIFTVDVSGSMNRENRLELVKGTLRMLLDQLGREDRIGLVVYGSRGEVVLEPTGDHDAIRRAIDRLRPAGSTNAEEGLMLAYDLINRHYRRGAIHRVILCSDGVANVGRTGHDSILEQIGASARRGIELTTVGFGMGNYNDVLMEQLADRGNGQYAYVDSPAEARRVFVENLTGTLQTIARDAKVQIEFDPETVARYRLIGYENRDIADDRFRDDTVDAGEIGAGHSVIALYEVKLQPGASREARLATLHLRYRDVDGGDRVVEIDRSLQVRDLHSSWDRAPESVRLATLVATFAEILGDSYWAREVSPTDLARRVRALAEDREDARLDELSAMVRAAAPLVESRRRARSGSED